MSDPYHEIIHAIVQGDQSAFAKLYHQFSERVYNTALSYSQSKQDAEEITQDVFVKVFRHAAKFKANSTVSTWIYRITVNTALNHLKKKKRAGFLGFTAELPHTPDFNHPGVLLENKELAQTLFKVVDTLPDKQKTAFILRNMEHLPQKEIAKIMELSEKAVESLLQRAKGNLRKKMAKIHPNRRK